ncbi:MAG: BatD family protein, partial [Planctomycetales bacterium]
MNDGKVNVSGDRIMRTLALLVALAASASAQDLEVEVATSRPPHYAGEPVVLQVSATGFAEDPPPKCEVKGASAGLTHHLVEVSPNISESVSIFNGRINRTRTVTWRFRYRILADQAGEHQVGPFEVTQGSKKVTGNQVPLSFQEIAEDPDVFIELTTPAKALYPGQRAKIRLRWG